jgi:NSS family neurotransmitter:Na+ symporter
MVWADTALRGLAGADVRAARVRFDALLAAPLTMTAYHSVYMATVAIIVARGISQGIEAACKILMPVLIGLIIALGLFSMTQGDLAATLRFLFRIDPAHMTLRVALDALFGGIIGRNLVDLPRLLTPVPL